MKSKTTILGILGNILSKNILNIIFLLMSISVVVLGKNNLLESPMVVYFDIGQGDSILLQQDDYQILIDGGPGDEIIFDLPKYMPWYDNKIEIVVLTHPHADHIDGLVHVLKEYEVGKILYNPIDCENKAYEFLKEEYKEILIPAKRGDTVEYKDIFLEVIYPFDSYDYQEKNINNESIILLAEINGYKLLFMGDAEQETEERILEEKLKDVYILKIGHHCSRTSTSQMFLNYVSPDIAVCSVGRSNKFGHPHYETIEKLENGNVQHLITYEEGDVLFRF